MFTCSLVAWMLIHPLNNTGHDWSWLENEVIVSIPEFMEAPTQMDSDGKGHYFILDQNKNVIFKVAADGTVLSSFGRPGEGPGEFKTVAGFALDRARDRIWVVDWWSTRLFCFDFNGTLLFQRNEQFSNDRIAIRPDGMFYSGGRGVKSTLAQYSNQAELLQWFGPEMKDSMRVMKDQLNHRFYMQTDAKGRLYLAYSHKPVVACYDLDLTLSWEKERFWLNQDQAPKPAKLEGMRLLGSTYHLSIAPADHVLYVGTSEEENAILAFDIERGKYLGHHKLGYRPRAMFYHEQTLFIIDSLEGLLHIYPGKGEAPFTKFQKSSDFKEIRDQDENVKILSTKETTNTQPCGGGKGCSCGTQSSGKCSAGCCGG